MKSEIIEAHDLTVTAAARVLGVTRQTVSDFLNCHAALSPDMAIRLEKAFGVSMETLMKMRTSYDIVQARQREGAIDVRPYKPALAV